MATMTKRGTIRERAASLAVVGAIVLSISLLLWNFGSYLMDIEKLRGLIGSMGVWAPLAFMFVNMVQVVVLPIPGSIVTMTGGALFGVMGGIALSMIASTIGFLIVFLLAKRYGERLKWLFVKEANYEKYDRAVRSPRVMTFVTLAFLFPVVPDPAAAYVAGLTPISTRKLLLVCVLARLPGVALTVIAGNYIAEQNYLVTGLLAVALLLTLMVVYVYRAPIDRLVAKLYY